MTLRVLTSAVVAAILALGGLLLAVRHFLAADLAALLGGLAIFLAVAVTGAVCLFNHCGWPNESKGPPTTEQVRERVHHDPIYRNAALRGLIAADLGAGLWIGITAAHPLVTITAYCLTLLAFKGLLGTVPRRLPPMIWLRAGIITCSVMLGFALQAVVN